MSHLVGSRVSERGNAAEKPYHTEGLDLRMQFGRPLHRQANIDKSSSFSSRFARIAFSHQRD